MGSQINAPGGEGWSVGETPNGCAILLGLFSRKRKEMKKFGASVTSKPENDYGSSLQLELKSLRGLTPRIREA